MHDGIVSFLTLCGGQMVGEVGHACPSIQVGVYKLTVILSMTIAICYTVECIWGGERMEGGRGVKEEVLNQQCIYVTP